MAAKSALRMILSDSNLSYEDMQSAALNKAKEYKLGVEYLSKLRREIHGVGTGSSAGDENVAMVVHDVVDRSFGELHGRLAHHVGNMGTEAEGAGKNTDARTDTQWLKNTDAHLQDTDAPACTDNQQLINDESTTYSLEKDSCVLTKSHISSLACKSTTDNMVCIPKASLNSLCEKIDSLTAMVVKQKEDLCDLEMRLKNEIKTRESHLVEVIGSFFSEQSVGKTETDVTATEDVAERPKSNQIKKRRKKGKKAVQFAETNAEPGNFGETDEEPACTSETAPETKPQTEQRTNDTTKNRTNPSNKASTTVKFGSTTFEPIQADEDDCWKLVVSKKPDEKKAVLYLGNVSQETTAENISKFVAKRCESLGVHTPQIFNCRVFPNKDSSHGATVSARITIPASAASVLKNRTFWPRPIYARSWKFQNLASGDQAAITLALPECRTEASAGETST